MQIRKYKYGIKHVQQPEIKAKGELEIAKREIEKRAGALDEEANSRKDSDGSISGRPSSLHLEINLTLEIGQLLLSLLHAWGLDKDLDKVATNKLGLLRPKVPVSYGILSKGGVMSLMLPTWYPRLKASNGNETRRYRCVPLRTAAYRLQISWQHQMDGDYRNVRSVG